MLSYSLENFLLVSGVLFCLGIFTVLTRRNTVAILMGIELILNAAGLNFVAFSRFVQTQNHISGHVFTLFIIVISAAEIAIALAIVLSLYSTKKTIHVKDFDELKW